MVLKIFAKICVLLFSAGFGIVAATLTASPIIFYANMTATDGPYFPPLLVALGLIAMPYAVMLFPVQIIVAVYEFVRKKALGPSLFIIGIVGDIVAFSILYMVIESEQAEPMLFWLLLVPALLQGLVVFGCHWITGKLKIGNFAVEDKVTMFLNAEG